MPAVIDGDKAFIGARTPGWHKLGVTKDGWFTADEALDEAYMDWEVTKLPVFSTLDPTGENVHLGTVGTDEFFTTVRLNPFTNQYQILGIVGEQYTPVQNREAFAFADEVVGNIGGAHYETAGVLRNGKQVFMTISTEALVLDEGERADKVMRYILLINSHDGSLAFSVRMTNVRVVCANTLAMALSASRRNKFDGKWSTRHTKDILNRAEMAKQTLGLWAKYNEEWAQQATKMIQTPLSDNQFTRIITGLFETTSNDGVTKEKDEEGISKVRAIYELAPTCENIMGTVWGGLNAVTEYADWFAEVRGGKKTSVEEARFRRQMDDPTNIKQKAWNTFYDLATAK